VCAVGGPNPVPPVGNTKPDLSDGFCSLDRADKPNSVVDGNLSSRRIATAIVRATNLALAPDATPLLAELC